MKLVRAIVIVLALLALPAAGAAAKPRPHAGQLDRGFGNSGRALVKLGASSPGPIFVEATAGSGVVIAGHRQVIELTARGRIDRSFGNHGRVALPDRPGVEFSLAGIALDAKGRVVVAGTFANAAAPSEWPKTVFVERLLADGRLDSGFADRGSFESTFGFPVPPSVGVRSLTPPQRFAAPVVEATGVALDPKGRVVVTGSYVTRELTGCTTYMGTVFPWFPSEGFVARLSGSGKLDGSFGSGGVVTAGETSKDSLPLIDPAGRIGYLQTWINPNCPGRAEGILGSHLRGLDPGGKPRAGFDARGAGLDLFVDGATEDTRMRPLLLGGRAEGIEAGPPEVIRVEPTGALDGGFGHGGRYPVVIGKDSFEVSVITADAADRVLLAGETVDGYFLQRLTAGGRLDRRFGSSGEVQAHFADSSARPTGIAVATDPRNRIDVAGIVSQPVEGGGWRELITLSRYLAG